MDIHKHLYVVISRPVWFVVDSRALWLLSILRVLALLLSIWVQWVLRIIPNLLYNPQPFCASLAEQDAIAHRQVFRTLHEPKRHLRPVSGANVLTVNVDYGTCLRDWSHMQHGLVLGFDGRGVRQDKNLGNKLAVHLWLRYEPRHRVRLVRLVQDHHAFANVFAPHVAQSQAGRLASLAPGYLYSFPLNRPDFGRGELAQAVRAHENGVTSMNLATLDHTGHYSAYERHGEGVIYVKLQWSIAVVVSVVWQDIQKRADQIEVRSGDIGDLENGTYSSRDELSLFSVSALHTSQHQKTHSSVDAFLPVLDEDWDFASTRRFEDFGQLGNRLLENLRRANVDFGDDNHHRHI